MFQKLKIFWSLFQKGKQVANPAFWKQQQSVVLPLVVSLLVACTELAKIYNIQIPLDQDTCYWIAGSLYFIVNFCLTYISSKHVGIGNTPESPTGALPQESRRDAESSVQSSLEGSYDHARDIGNVQVVSGDASTSRFDDETHKRAQEWLDKQTQPGGVFYSP